MKIKLMIVCCLAAITALVSGCTSVHENTNLVEGDPTGSFADRSTRSGLDVGLGTYHSETVTNNVSSTNIGGYYTTDTSTASKKSVNVPLIGSLRSCGRSLLNGLAMGAEMVPLANGPFYGYDNGGYCYQGGPGYVAPLVLYCPTGGGRHHRY